MVKDYLTANCLEHIVVGIHSFDYCYFVFDSGDHLEKLKFVLECVIEQDATFLIPVLSSLSKDEVLLIYSC